MNPNWLQENMRWTPEKQEKKTCKWMANRAEWIRRGRPRRWKRLKFSKKQLAALPKSYREAKREAVLFYFTGKPCRKGHLTARKVNSRHCYECQRAMNAIGNQRTAQMPTILTPVPVHREMRYKEIVL